MTFLNELQKGLHLSDFKKRLTPALNLSPSGCSGNTLKTKTRATTTSVLLRWHGLTILHHLRWRGTTSNIVKLKTFSMITKLTKYKHIWLTERKRELMLFHFSRETQNLSGTMKSIRMEGSSSLTLIQILKEFKKFGKLWCSKQSQARSQSSISFVEYGCWTKARKVNQASSELRFGLSSTTRILRKEKI